jgi:hypothetical protein
MAEGLPIERLREFLRELKPAARTLLATELERAMLRGEDPPGASFILDELRSEARNSGRKMPRVGNPQRLFFVPLEPFLVEDSPERKHRGRISRANLDPIWEWICRDLMPQEAKTYADQINMLLAANQKDSADQVARAFQDLVEHRLREVLVNAKTDDKLRRRVSVQVGTPFALEDVREVASIMRARDALAVIGTRLPQAISNLADEQRDNVMGLLESPIGRHKDIFLYALIIVMSRLAAPWQLVRLAIKAAESDSAARIAETSYAVAVDIVLTDIDRMIATLRGSLKTANSMEVATLLKEIHDSARTLRTEVDLSGDSPWGRQLAASRAEVAKLLLAEIDNLPGQVRRLLRPRPAKEVGPDSVLDPGDVADVEAKLVLASLSRNYAGELAVSEATRRVNSELQNYFDSGTQVLLDRMRSSPAAERSFRHSQLDAAVRFCGKLFGADYASTLAKAADVAAKGEQKAMKA